LAQAILAEAFRHLHRLSLGVKRWLRTFSAPIMSEHLPTENREELLHAQPEPQASISAPEQHDSRGLGEEEPSTLPGRVPDVAIIAIGLPIVFWAVLTLVGFAAMLYTFGRSLVTMTYIYARSWCVLLQHGSDPCDVPLAKVVLGCLLLVPVYLARNCMRSLVYRIFCLDSTDAGQRRTPLRAKLLCWACCCLAYYIVFAGVDMVKHAQTCRKTAPDLYNWAAYLFPAGIVHFLGLHVLAACSGLGLLRAVLHTLPSCRASSGVEPAVIARLESVLADTTAERQCSICLDSYREGQRAKVTPCCRNMFHEECIEDWLKSHRSCPLCRADIQEVVGSMV